MPSTNAIFAALVLNADLLILIALYLLASPSKKVKKDNTTTPKVSMSPGLMGLSKQIEKEMYNGESKFDKKPDPSDVLDAVGYITNHTTSTNIDPSSFYSSTVAKKKRTIKSDIKSKKKNK